MGIPGLQTVLKNPSHAIRETEKVLEDLRTEQDPLVAHILPAARPATISGAPADGLL